MKKRLATYLLVFLSGAWLLACNNSEKPAASVPTPKTPQVMPPFRYHKLVEVSPGQDYDVVSWGRGSTKTGAYAILHSDSAAAKFVTTTGDLTGTIVDVFNTDMDLDGNPEIIIQAKGIDTNNYTNIYAFEFTNGHAEKLDFPKLSKQQRRGYRGEDSFYVKDGKLFREFPLFDGDAKLTAQKRQLEYGLRDNSFTVKPLSKDSTNVSNSVKSTTHPVQNKPKTEKHKTASRTRHKKKRRKHRSGE
jgi:hypothetical protein